MARPETGSYLVFSSVGVRCAVCRVSRVSSVEVSGERQESPVTRSQDEDQDQGPGLSSGRVVDGMIIFLINKITTLVQESI
eukprot:scaffold5329_cov41-Cyclotella_meneghiniana.AAC.4